MAIVLRCMTLSKLCYLITVAFYPHVDPFDSRSVCLVLRFPHLSHRSFLNTNMGKKKKRKDCLFEGKAILILIYRFCAC